MQFDQRDEGDYRIYVGALEGAQGDGYTAALVIHCWRGPTPDITEVHREESLACGHRWVSAKAALSFAMSRGLQLVQYMHRESVPAAVQTSVELVSHETVG